MIKILVKQAYTDFLVLRIIRINPVFIIIIQKVNKFRTRLECNSILNKAGMFVSTTTTVVFTTAKPPYPVNSITTTIIII